MSEESLQRRLARMEERVRILEDMIEDRTRELYMANLQLERSTRFLRGVFSAMPTGLVVLDAENRIETINEAACRIFGCDEARAVGRTICEFFGDQCPAHLSVIRRDPGYVLRMETECRALTGDVVPVLASATALPLPGTDANGVVMALLDHRDKRRLEVELRQAQKLESLGKLAAGVAHEINTPIQFVSDSLEYLRSACDDLMGLVDRQDDLARTHPKGEELEELLDIAREDADLDYARGHLPKALARCEDGIARVAAIVRSLKDFAHPEQRNMTPSDVNRAIRGTLAMARSRIDAVAELDLALGEVPLVSCNVGQLNQAVLSLIENACEAIAARVSREGGRGRIGVATEQRGDTVLISVSDDGGGIPEAIRERIFDPFFTTKDVGQGTGQGLAIVRSVLERHGGQVTFETELGRGSRFVLRLCIDGPKGQNARSAA